MAYAAVASLMETLSLHFLQSQPLFPLEGLKAKSIRDGANKHLDWLQKILEAEMRKQQLACHYSIPLLTSRLREVAQLKQKILSLHQNLGLLQQSLEKSEIACHDAEMKALEAQIRDASFKAEQRIEVELTTFHSLYVFIDVAACQIRLYEIINEAEKQTDYHRNELIRIQTDKYQLAEVSLLGRIRRRGLLQLVKGSSLSDLVHNNIIVTKFFKKSSKFNSTMVGCHEVFTKILDQLTQQSIKRRHVVSIVGMGGIGKTTLAHKVYEHPSITSYFDKRAWVTVSQEYNVEQMLRCLLSCVTRASRDGQDQLAERLLKHLKEQRYLIVIDDIWSTTAWDTVLRCFPDDNNGSRILLTSRLRDVAEYASSGNSPLNMPFLDVDESWNLYCKVFGKTEFLSVFEQIGRDIVKKCEGLPLAITVVASLLSKTEEVEKKWKNVAKSVIIGDSNDACSRILYLSYHQLPHHLKACFLYFGIFREDYEIPVKKLVRLWAAEGFLRDVKDLNSEEVATKCLKDLVDRSLVIVSKHSYNGEMKRIRIHDLLLDLCLREVRLENLLDVNGVKKPCRWITHTSGFIYSFEDECFHKSQSFHCTHFYYSRKADVKRLFSHLKLLRVVDIRGSFSNEEMTPDVLENLFHLRYLALSIHLSIYEKFYIKLFEHWNMQSFIVSGLGVALDPCEANRISKMPLLRNFCIGESFSLALSVVHRNLENISWLNSKLCAKDLFTMLPNLKKLGVDCGYFGNNLDWFYNVVHLGKLETLRIKRWEEFNLTTCSVLWATSLPNLKKLSLLQSNILWSELSAISMLPNLEVLKLINACEGSKWETCYGGFHRLKRLVIRRTNLQYWNAVDDHFPMLECLELSGCYRLEEIPRGFVDIITLALIQISKCKVSLVASAKWIQQEQKNYGNDALLVRSENNLE